MKQKVEVRVIDSKNNKDINIYPYAGENLLDTLERSFLFTKGVCGKAGTCGKCTVQVIEGFLDITPGDRKLLTSNQLAQGYRLACMAYPKENCTVILNSFKSDSFKVVTKTINHAKTHRSGNIISEIDDGYLVAIDIGTTTLALVLTNSVGQVLDKYTVANPQRVYGADVISRIKASNEGKKDNLTGMIRKELSHGILSLIDNSNINITNIRKITISGNTTMIHLLMGYPCEGLSSYPFTPYMKGIFECSSDELFEITEKIPVMILPAISAFVGGDITAGLLSCGFDFKDNPCLFIDLGTNGEIALGNKEKILVTSTSAGPAFEGGNISCGVGSIPGAICHVTITDGYLKYDTIDGAAPIGLCGTGLIELVSQLLKENIIDSTGLLIDECFDNGYEIDGIKLLQEDIRKLQLAKAAIRTGVEILIRNYGITYEQINKVYIAGGFGYHLNINKAVDIGLLPKEVLNKTEAVGNTALSGAILTAIETCATDRLEHIMYVSKEIHLSNEKDFNDLFIQYISF